MLSTSPGLAADWISEEAKLFLLTCLFTTTFVPCFPVFFSTLHIPGIVTPPQLVKGKEIEVPIYLFGKFPLVLNPLLFLNISATMLILGVPD